MLHSPCFSLFHGSANLFVLSERSMQLDQNLGIDCKSKFWIIPDLNKENGNMNSLANSWL